MNIRRRIIFQFEEDVFSKGAQNISRTYHETIFSMKFLPTKPQVKSMNIDYYDSIFTVNKNRDEKDFIEDNIDYENNENDVSNFGDNIIPNHRVGIKAHETMLTQTKLRSRTNQFK